MRRMILLRLLLLTLIVPIAGDCLIQDRYVLNVDLPADIVQDVTIIDTLPRGLIYKNDSLNITGADDFDEHVSGPNDASQEAIITWNFGRVNNTADKDIQISFEAVVANVPGNHAGVTLHPNKASLK
ncbi:MAG: isopeptide-forming domain-containing fimbrial protein, partial [Methanotrichaceae archaeon]